MEHIFNLNREAFSKAAKGHTIEEFKQELLEYPNLQIVKFLKIRDLEQLYKIALEY